MIQVFLLSSRTWGISILFNEGIYPPLRDDFCKHDAKDKDMISFFNVGYKNSNSRLKLISLG